MNAVTIHRVDSVPSTQDILHDLAQAGAPAGTAVVAAEQTLGRGSRGRGWDSPRGGLWMSVLLRPWTVAGLEVISLRAALSVAEAIESVIPGLRLALKWPNDLLLGGRKVGGILCEARWQGGIPGWIAVGIGLNVANPVPAGLEERAIALMSVAPTITPDQLLDPVARAISELNDQVGLLTAVEQDRLRGRDALLARRIREPISGLAEGIAADGSLVIRVPDGTRVEARTGPVVVADD